MTHVSEWTVRLYLSEDEDTTTVHAVLDTGANVLTGRGTAQRNPADSSVPEIGDEVAAGRALADLGHQLATAAACDIEAISGTPATVTI
jgi:hypothetical protein